ncbi:hypothetical protein BN2475_380123 [Paraburkholderia ribeironis]|uniref:Uncharacterized protein n=1 Tax=Paraburkholderia ribeironis TaxID=1247936 RepID=A0A1N7S605_9BURK|nr:hypothetical protein BN2475_380123 [Paraburkholderia ribeironis]
MELLLPAAVEPAELLLLLAFLLPLAWVAAVLLEPSLPPPPPHPASTRERVESRRSCDFINL